MNHLVIYSWISCLYFQNLGRETDPNSHLPCCRRRNLEFQKSTERIDRSFRDSTYKDVRCSHGNWKTSWFLHHNYHHHEQVEPSWVFLDRYWRMHIETWPFHTERHRILLFHLQLLPGSISIRRKKLIESKKMKTFISGTRNSHDSRSFSSGRIRVFDPIWPLSDGRELGENKPVSKRRRNFSWLPKILKRNPKSSLIVSLIGRIRWIKIGCGSEGILYMSAIKVNVVDQNPFNSCF